jgi:hypothetical protein
MGKNGDTGRSAATLGGIALGGLLGTTVLCGTAPAMAAGDGDMLDLSGLERVTDNSLGDLRGGFRLGNLDITFGVQVTTSVNGQEILQTSFNMLDPGQFTPATTTYYGGNQNNNNTQTYANYGGQYGNPGAAQGVSETVSAVAQDVASGDASGGGMTGFQPASAAPLPTEATTASDPSAVPASLATGGWTFNQTDSGVQAVSADFATTIMHEISSSVTTANITNTADNQTISNDTQLDLFINNFEVVQMQSITNQVISGMMTEMINAGGLGF